VRPEDLLTTPPLAEQLAEAVERLPAPEPEQFEALRRLLEDSERSTVAAEWPALLRGPYVKRDTRYAPPPTSHRPLVGPALVLAKRAFRLAFQPFINEILRRQVEFNEALLDSLARLYEQQREEVRLYTAWRREMAARLERLEAQARAPQQAGGQDPKGPTGAR
jgi:hypothetical protein